MSKKKKKNKAKNIEVLTVLRHYWFLKQQKVNPTDKSYFAK